MPEISQELTYLVLIFGLMVVPRILQRWRIPAPMTSFALGVAAAWLLGRSSADDTLTLLATLGIASLFLFAGLEVEVQDFRSRLVPLFSHLVARTVVLLVLVYGCTTYLGLSWQVSALLALALLTPSTGFILETLSGLGLDEAEQTWVRIKAVAGEMFALLVLFVVLQSGSARELGESSLVLLALIAGLPLLFLALDRVVIPYARGSEFSLLVMVGFVAAYVTYQIGVYYLVGAFLTGFVARVMRNRMPTLASDGNLHAIQMFASFFVPFYFFHKGLSVPLNVATVEALMLGLLITLIVLPARLAVIWTQRRFIKGESREGSLRVAVALAPTLIFTLVLATIMRERYGIDDRLYGALLVYAGLTTILPSIVLAKPFAFGMPSTANPVPSKPAPGAGSGPSAQSLAPQAPESRQAGRDA